MKKGILITVLITVTIIGYAASGILNIWVVDANGQWILDTDSIDYNFLNWNPATVYLYVTSIIVLPIVISAFLFNKNETKQADAWLGSAININEYSEKNAFDAVMAHYTNVATVGLLISLIIFSVNKFFESNSIKLTITIIFIAVSFSLYTAFFSKICCRFFNQNVKGGENQTSEYSVARPYFLVTAMLVIDYLLILMFISNS